MHFLLTLSSTYVQRDISQIGEQGMQIQMVLLNDRKDDIQDEDSLIHRKRELLKEEIEQQAMLIIDYKGDRSE